MTHRVHPAPEAGDSTHALFTEDGLALTIAVGEVPAHSPYQSGDWVVCHGYPGVKIPGPRKWGFRGYVIGSYGNKYLWGVTDDGREWSESWGSLLPDGAADPVDMCTCCPHQPRKRVRPQVDAQLDLFDLAYIFGASR